MFPLSKRWKSLNSGSNVVTRISLENESQASAGWGTEPPTWWWTPRCPRKAWKSRSWLVTSLPSSTPDKPTHRERKSSRECSLKAQPRRPWENAEGPLHPSSVGGRGPFVCCLGVVAVVIWASSYHHPCVMASARGSTPSLRKEKLSCGFRKGLAQNATFKSLCIMWK